jgi:hypothetical protein
MGVSDLPTLAEVQQQRRAEPKPAKGTSRLQLRKDRSERRSNEKDAKAEARIRDGYRNRWPGNPNAGERLESAHYRGKGMGGDHGLRSTVTNLITFDYLTHQGPRSIHSMHKKVVPLTRKYCSGPCAFFERAALPGGKFGKWRKVGEEIRVGVLR